MYAIANCDLKADRIWTMAEVFKGFEESKPSHTADPRVVTHNSTIAHLLEHQTKNKLEFTDRDLKKAYFLSAFSASMAFWPRSKKAVYSSRSGV